MLHIVFLEVRTGFSRQLYIFYCRACFTVMAIITDNRPMSLDFCSLWTFESVPFCYHKLKLYTLWNLTNYLKTTISNLKTIQINSLIFPGGLTEILEFKFVTSEFRNVWQGCQEVLKCLKFQINFIPIIKSITELFVIQVYYFYCL